MMRKVSGDVAELQYTTEEFMLKMQHIDSFAEQL